MHYKFDNMSGRVMGASNIQTPLSPITPLAHAVEAPKIMYGHGVTFATIAPATGGRSQLAGGVAESFRRKQELFQKPNEIPVFLKGGPADKALFMLTVGLCGLGIVGMVHFFYNAAKAKK